MTRTRERGDLSRTEVITAALGVLDAGGIGACTVRAIAAELGVSPMAIYWHVKDKDELLDGVLDAIFADVDAAVPTTEPFGALAAVARGYRQTFARHPHAAPLLASRPMHNGPAAQSLAERTVALLATAGLTGNDLTCAYLLLAQFVMGSVITEHAHAPTEPAGMSGLALPDAHTRFEFGLTCLLAGVREQVGQRRG